MKTIVKILFGSHLYGTNTPESDQDFKGVFIESLENIILKKDKRVIVNSTGNDTSKNSKNDIDVELKELRTFLKEAMDGQTYALDMLFAPSKFILSSTGWWDEIQRNRDKLLSSNLAPFIGYCRHQAGKYGLKGSRLGELERVIEIVKGVHGDTFVGDLDIPRTEFVKDATVKKQDKEFYYLEVLGRKFDIKLHCKDMLKVLLKTHEKYGARSKMAQKNKGVDWKAISHAYRCMYELKELKETGEIVFPLRDRSHLLLIKKGEIPYSKIQEELPVLMDEVLNMKSDLPDEPNRKFWDNFLLDVYIGSR